MSFGYYWTPENKVRDCEVIDIDGRRAYVEDDETHEREWVNVDDVQPAAIDDWHEANGQFGVGA